MAANKPTHCYICGTKYREGVCWHVHEYGCNLCKTAMTKYRNDSRKWFTDERDVRKLPRLEQMKRLKRIFCLQSHYARQTHELR